MEESIKDILKRIYKSSEPLYCNHINFHVFSDKEKTDRIFCLGLDNDYNVSDNKDNICIDYYLESSVKIIKLYNRLRNDILMNNIDQEELFNLIEKIENIFVTYKLDLKNIYDKRNLNHLYELYLYIKDLLIKFCKLTGTYCTVDFVGLTDSNYIKGKNIYKDINDC